MACILDDPLASIGVRGLPCAYGPGGATSCSATTPLALRSLQPAPDSDVPPYLYDSLRQVATDLAGAPLGPWLDKQWTTIPGTHRDGDGGDNENWDWEEV